VTQRTVEFSLTKHASDPCSDYINTNIKISSKLESPHLTCTNHFITNNSTDQLAGCYLFTVSTI